MTLKPIPRYVDHLWYPILVPHAGGNRIVEMQGWRVNEWNDMVAAMKIKTTRCYPIGCI